MADLKDVDLSAKLNQREAQAELEVAQRRLLALRLTCAGLIGDGHLGPPLCIVFEGWDAAGKGGAIRRLTAGLDPRHVHVSEYAAPTEREKRHHFLWRFWPSLPGWGGMCVFDRSWYGRVLVERVEGFATEAQWRRAYDEIVTFETGLCAEGMILVKFWMHISEHEQLRRYRARERDPLKRWKLTDEDWRNLAHRADYERAVSEMLRRTDHKKAPWHVIAAENKPYARVDVLRHVNAAIEDGLRAIGREPPDVEAKLYERRSDRLGDHLDRTARALLHAHAAPLAVVEVELVCIGAGGLELDDGVVRTDPVTVVAGEAAPARHAPAGFEQGRALVETDHDLVERARTSHRAEAWPERLGRIGVIPRVQ